MQLLSNRVNAYRNYIGTLKEERHHLQQVMLQNYIFIVRRMKFTQCLLSNTENIVKETKDLRLKREMLKLLEENM